MYGYEAPKKPKPKGGRGNGAAEVAQRKKDNNGLKRKSKVTGKSDIAGKNKRENDALVARRRAQLKKQNELATMSPKKIDSRTKAQRIKDSAPAKKIDSRTKAQRIKDQVKKPFGFAMKGNKMGSRINFDINKKKKK